MKNISASLTAEQIVASVQHVARGEAPLKDVTRRLGWLKLKVGERLQVCQKCMGRKPGEPLIRLAIIEVTNVRREPLNHLRGIPEDREYGLKEVNREGFPDMHPSEFIHFFCQSHKGCTPGTLVTRIEFIYVLPITPNFVP